MDTNSKMSSNQKIMLAVIAVAVLGGAILLTAKPKEKLTTSEEMASTTEMQADKDKGTVVAPKVTTKPQNTPTNPLPKATDTGMGVTSTGSNSANPTANTDVAAPERVSVMIQGNAYVPASIKVKKGTIVTWTNKDKFSHTVTGEQNVGPGSNDIISNQSYTYTFNQVGQFPYFCAGHEFMHGFVEVVE